MSEKKGNILKTFEEFDADNAGFTKHRLIEILTIVTNSQGGTVSRDRLSELLATLAQTNDGRIRTKDFIDFLYGDPRSSQPRGLERVSSRAATVELQGGYEGLKSKGLAASVAGLRIIQVTDVYTLENFPSLKTMIATKREEAALDGLDTISMLTGDFLAPYLLSSVDRGKGMMTMINETPIDYLTWGNHDGNDLAADAVRERESEYEGVLINSNMIGHETFAESKCQCDRAVIDVRSRDKTHSRKIGLCAVLSNSKDLYRPTAFNGAKIEDPWDTLRIFKDKLEKTDGCDLVIPLCHLYEPQDERTCREFDFPLILSGHDHHVVDREISGSRLLKPGQDARKAHIIDITWNSAAPDCKPIIEVETVDVTKYAKDPVLEAQARQCYTVLEKLKYTGLYPIGDELRPLTSFGARNRNVTMGTFLCSKMRDALNHTRHAFEISETFCDCVLLKGANVRGGTDYPDSGPGSNFTLQALLAETQDEHELFMFRVPGKCIKYGLRETWTQAGPGWFQYSDDVKVDANGLVTHIAGEPIDEQRLYNVASIKDLSRAADGPTIGNYLSADPSRIPTPDSGYPVRPLLLTYFAERVWEEIFKALDAHGNGEVSIADISKWDTDGDGTLDKNELKAIIRSVSHIRTSDAEDSFVDLILDIAGDNGDGHLTVEEINTKRIQKGADLDLKRQHTTLHVHDGKMSRRTKNLL